MKRHEAIIRLGLALNYFDTFDINGVCHGVRMAWIEACFLGEENLFDERIDFIMKNIAEIPGQIEAIKQKFMLHKAVTEEEKRMLEILGFFEKISLFQRPEKYPNFLMQASTFQNDIDKVSSIIKSNKMEEKGAGFNALYRNYSHYSLPVLVQYLISVAECLRSHSVDFNQGVSLCVNLLELSFGNHAIAIYFETKDDRLHLRFMDINNEQSELFPADDADAVLSLVQSIHKKYYLESEQMIKAEMTLLCCGNLTIDPQVLTTALQSLEGEARDKAPAVFLQFAMQNGDIGFISKQPQENVQQILQLPAVGVHYDTWCYLLSEKMVDEASIFSHKASPLCNLKIIVELLQKKSITERIDILNQHLIFEKLFDCNARYSPSLAFILEALLALIPSEVFHELALDSVLCEQIRAGASDLNKPFLRQCIEVFLKYVAPEAHDDTVVDLITTIPAHDILSFLLEQLPYEKRSEAVCFYMDYNRGRRKVCLALQFAVYPKAMAVIFEKVLPEEHHNILNMRGKAKPFNCRSPSMQNILHAAIQYPDSLEIIFQYMPAEVRFNKVFNENDEFGRSAWNYLFQGYIFYDRHDADASRDVILKYLTPEERAILIPLTQKNPVVQQNHSLFKPEAGSDVKKPKDSQDTAEEEGYTP